MTVRRDALVGSLLGTAVGDSVGLAYEGLSRRRARRLFGDEVRHRLVFGRGMVSDDTEHSCLAVQALIAAGDDPERFANRMANGLRLWLLGVPAGAGLATVRATLKLCVGIPPHRSGVFSAGNGPAMRAAVLGAAIDNIELLQEFVRTSSRLTHTDPKAEHGALAVALAAQLASRGQQVAPDAYLKTLETAMQGISGEELLRLVGQAVKSVRSGQSTQDFAAELGLARGVSGYMLHTVPVALHCWLSHQGDYRAAVTEIVLCGGDTDSTAAIVGGIIGSSVGKAGIPLDWLNAIWEWPRSIRWMEGLADQLHLSRSSGMPTEPQRLPIYGVVPRNALFTTIVLVHGVRRLFPPY